MEIAWERRPPAGIPGSAVIPARMPLGPQSLPWGRGRPARFGAPTGARPHPRVMAEALL